MGSGGGVPIRIAVLAPVLLLLSVPVIPAMANSPIPAGTHHTHAAHKRHAKAHVDQSRHETTRATPIDLVPVNLVSNAALAHAAEMAAAAPGSRTGWPALRPGLRRAPNHSGVTAPNRSSHDGNSTPNSPSTTPTIAGTPVTIRPPAGAAIAPLQPSTSPTRSRPTTAPSPPSSAVPSGGAHHSKRPGSLGSILARPLHSSLEPLPIAIAIMLAAIGTGVLIMLSGTHRRRRSTTPAAATIGRHRETGVNRSIERIDDTHDRTPVAR
jgi:hypothetical protein